MNNRKRKIIQLQCLSCNSILKYDYKLRIHKKKQHAGKRVLVRYFITPNNPFLAACVIAMTKVKIISTFSFKCLLC